MKSRIFLLLLGFLFLWASPAGAQTGGGEFAGGDGSEEKPFLIENKYQLRNLNRYLGESRGGKHFKLVKDIVFEQTDFEWGGDFYNAGKGWTPIGENGRNSFYRNVFDGNGFSIRGLYSSRDAYTGLFGYIGSSTVRNLYLLDCRFILGGSTFRPHAGMLTGHIEGGKIDHCYCEGKIQFKGWDTSYVGGIAGEVSKAEITNCYAGIVVRQDMQVDKKGSGYNIGGIAGVVINEGTVRNCYADVDMKADTASMGGIVGCAWKWDNKGGLVENSYVRGYLSSGRALGGVASACDLSTLRGNCVLLSGMEGKGVRKNRAGVPAINRVNAEGDSEGSFQGNYVSEKMKIVTDAGFLPENDKNGKDGALCPQKPDLAFWKNLGFAFGGAADAPWVFSSSGYPVIYGFENLDAIYVRTIPDTDLGNKFKSLYEYFVRNRENCRKSREKESASELSRLTDSYKKDLEGELKKYEEENRAMASVVKKEWDAVNSGKMDKRIDSGLPETVAKRKTSYLMDCSILAENAAKWDTTLLLLKERYRDGLVAFQKDCLVAGDMKLAALAERELKKL